MFMENNNNNNYNNSNYNHHHNNSNNNNNINSDTNNNDIIDNISSSSNSSSIDSSNISGSSKSNNNSSVIIQNINSIKQISNWDCGVACLSSILEWSNKQHEYRVINDIINTKSIWSIDLSNALTQLNVPHIYYTNSIGVRNDYSEKKYYKDNWESDTLRVNQLFFKTLNSSPCNLVLIASEKQLTISQFIDHINKGLPIILLVDSTFLCCNKCRPKSSSSQSSNGISNNKELNSGDYLNDSRSGNSDDGDNQEYKNSTNQYETDNIDSDSDTFFGHYIVLVGFNYDTNEIIYIDPSSTQSFCTIGFDDLDNARMKPGTDLDCIFITNQQ